MCSVKKGGNLFEAIEHVAKRRFELEQQCQHVILAIALGTWFFVASVDFVWTSCTSFKAPTW